MKTKPGFFQTRQKAFVAIVCCFLGTALVPQNGFHFQPYTFQSFVAGLLFGLGAFVLYRELRNETLEASKSGNATRSHTDD